MENSSHQDCVAFHHGAYNRYQNVEDSGNCPGKNTLEVARRSGHTHKQKLQPSAKA